MTNYNYDFFVVGAGSGGVRAARIAASHGAKVGIAEYSRLGGTCVNRGCVPKKLMVYASHFKEDFIDAKAFGWSFPQPNFDWEKLIGAIDHELYRLNDIYKSLLVNSGVDILYGKAKFIDSHTIDIEGKQITAGRFLIATGGTPYIPDVLGKEHINVSDDVFEMKSLPQHIVIAGAGYIAVEFACIFASLGVKVTQIFRADHILRGFDNDVRALLEDNMRKKDITLLHNTNIIEIEKQNEEYILRTDTQIQVPCDYILYATGRHPNIEGLNLEQLNIETNSKGAIHVNNESQTSCENIFAVGDVTDRINLTPVAIREGHCLADRLFGNQERYIDYNFIPTAIFSQPSIGTVGLTEEQAREKTEINIYKSEFRPMKNTISLRDEKNFMKLITDKKTNQVIGCHILGHDAPEIIQSAAIALKLKATKADFDETIGVHPTAAEELVTLK